MEIYVMVTRVVCQTKKLLMLQVVVGARRLVNIILYTFRLIKRKTLLVLKSATWLDALANRMS